MSDKDEKITEGTIRAFCACKHEGQDRMYGIGLRVHNSTRKLSGGRQLFRCTVCGNERIKKMGGKGD